MGVAMLQYLAQQAVHELFGGEIRLASSNIMEMLHKDRVSFESL